MTYSTSKMTSAPSLFSFGKIKHKNTTLMNLTLENHFMKLNNLNQINKKFDIGSSNNLYNYKYISAINKIIRRIHFDV